MIPGQLRQFMQELKRATESGEARWNTSPFGGFTCEKGVFSMGIWHHPHDDDGVERIGFRIADTSGQTRFMVAASESDYAEMSNIYASVSAAANNLAEKLQNLFRA